jgi:hypothetical protein
LTALIFTAPQHEAWIKKRWVGLRLKYELEENQDLEPVDKKSATSFPNKY